MNFLLALATSATIATLAWRARTLTPSGAFAATAVGTGILLGGGWPGGAVLLSFFLSSSAVSRILPEPTDTGLDNKGDCRDQWQVLANGGAAAMGALAGAAVLGGPGWIVTASLAAAGADTWATSFGELSPTPPRHVLSGEPVRRGTSGGITIQGSLGGAAGAAVVALVGAVGYRSAVVFVVAAPIGFLMMLLDSVLGAAGQGKFHCQGCDQPTERRVHRCGRVADHRAGFIWLTNDGVNALATFAAALAGWGAWATFGR